MTDQIKKKLRDELNTLEHELAYDIPRELKKAVAMGEAGYGRVMEHFTVERQVEKTLAVYESVLARTT